MTLKLYYDLASPPCRAVIILLKLLNVEYEAKEISLSTLETRTEAFKKINPMGHIPVIDDDGFILTEGDAILKYIANKYNAADHWYPADRAQRARVDEFLAWQPTGLRKNVIEHFFPAIVLPVFMQQALDKVKIEAAKPEMEKALNLMENYFLKDRDFVATNDVTLADLRGISELLQASATGYDATKGRPKVAAWMSRVQEKLNPHFDEANKAIIALGKMTPK